MSRGGACVTFFADRNDSFARRATRALPSQSCPNCAKLFTSTKFLWIRLFEIISSVQLLLRRSLNCFYKKHNVPSNHRYLNQFQRESRTTTKYAWLNEEEDFDWVSNRFSCPKTGGSEEGSCERSIGTREVVGRWRSRADRSRRCC